MKKYFLIIFFLFNYVNTNAQLEKTKCTFSGYLFYSDCDKYFGDCSSNKANGIGTLFFKNGSITGYFKNNLIQNCNIKYTSNTDNSIIFGQNIGTKFEGACMLVRGEYVSPSIYSEGKYKGNSLEMVKIPSPNFETVGNFCVTQSYNIDRVIPGTKYIICNVSKEFTKTGEEKHWFVLVDYQKNIIIKQFGSFEKPLSLITSPEFVQFNRYNFPIYKISGKFYKIDLNSYTFKIVDTEDFIDITNNKRKNQKIKSVSYHGMCAVDTLSPYYRDFMYVQTDLSDSSYLLKFNNRKYYSSITEVNNVKSAIVRFNRKNNPMATLELNGYNIVNFAIDENSNRLAAFYMSRDSIFLSYFNLNNLKLLSAVYSKKRPEYMEMPKIRFSKTGLYLIQSSRNGTLVFMGSDLHYACYGEYLNINNGDNIISTQENNSTMFWDLEKKQIFSKLSLPFQYQCLNSDESCFIIPCYFQSPSTSTYFTFPFPKSYLPIVGWQTNPDFYSNLDKLRENMSKSLNTSTVNIDQNLANNRLSASNQGNGNGLKTEQLLSNMSSGEFQIFNVAAFYRQMMLDFQNALSGEYDDDDDDDDSHVVMSSNSSCSSCNGRGKNDCGYCNSRGDLRCDDCFGHGVYSDGVRTCSHCKGRGTYRCYHCSGRGWFNCRDCDGSGKK